ncbi:MAG: hypothetical protein R3E83_17625 [Burkholderiaceae bacterium]
MNVTIAPLLTGRRARIGALITLATASLTLTACGGGGGTAVGTDTDKKEVVSGFSGDLAFFDPSINNEGIGGGADGDGGVGIGGSLGQFRGAEVVVTLPDGSELGRAIVDDVNGMVTVRPGRTYSGPLLIEVRGAAGATYFDEGRRQRVPFPAGEVLRARVPVVRGNIGVTTVTEAAARLQDASPASGDLASQIKRALDTSASEFSQYAPAGYDIDDPTRLPVLLNDTSGRGSAPNTSAGRYALLLAALADNAAAFNPTLASPALAFARQIGADLTDGRINGVQASGAAPAPEAEMSYSQVRLADQLVTALAASQDRYADPASIAPVPSVVKHARFSVPTSNGTVTNYRAVLLSNGHVEAQPEAGLALGPVVLVATGVRALFSGLDNFANRMALIMRREDGSFIGVGNNGAPPQAPNDIAYQFGQASPAFTLANNPITLAALNDLKMIGYGSAHQIGLRQNGTVVTWGSNSRGQLTVANPATVDPTPGIVALPGSARAVAGTADVSLAVLNDGTVHTWGSDNLGALGQGSLVSRLSAPGPVVTASGAPLTDVVSIQTCFRTAVVVRRDGSVWAWGDDSLGLLGQGAATNLERGHAEPVPGLPPIRKLVMGDDGAYALSEDGRVFYWGLTATGGRSDVVEVTGVAGTRDVITLGSGAVSAQDNAGNERVMRFGSRA